MTRDADPALITILSGPHYAVTLVQVDWPGGTVRVHTGVAPLVWSGQTWLGVGMRGALQLPADMAGLASMSGSMALGGLPEDIDDVLTADSPGSAVVAWHGALTARTGSLPGGDVLAAEPVQAWAGFTDDVNSETARAAMGLASRVTVGLIGRGSQRARTSAVHTYESQLLIGGDTAGRHTKAALALTREGAVKW